MGRKLTRNGLIKKNWSLCRQIVFKLRGRKCELCENDTGLEVDHCFSRNTKVLFYEIENLTVLCCNCHSHKTYRRKSMDLKVYEHVEAREGREKFEEMRKLSEALTSFPDWAYMWYHEAKHEELKQELEDLA